MLIAVKRFGRKWMVWNLIIITFHDLKRKGISDTTASERMASAGHRSIEMMKVYDVRPDIVKPTKNDQLQLPSQLGSSFSYKRTS